MNTKLPLQLRPLHKSAIASHLDDLGIGEENYEKITKKIAGESAKAVECFILLIFWRSLGEVYQLDPLTPTVAIWVQL